MIPLKPPVSSMMATLLTFSRRLLTTQAPPTYAKPSRGCTGGGVEFRILVVKSRTIFTGGSKELLCVCKRCPLKRGGLGGTLLTRFEKQGGKNYNQITNNLSLGEVQAKADLTLLKVCTVCLRLCEKIM